MTVISLLLAFAAFTTFVIGVSTGDLMWYMLVIVFAVLGLIIWGIDLCSKRK